jgi:predicted RNA-binding Zn-ribbon protein involved in translation (DUF1610 family)
MNLASRLIPELRLVASPYRWDLLARACGHAIAPSPTILEPVRLLIIGLALWWTQLVPVAIAPSRLPLGWTNLVPLGLLAALTAVLAVGVVRRVNAYIRLHIAVTRGTVCPACGYDLTGLVGRTTDHRCPECGVAINDPRARIMVEVREAEVFPELLAASSVPEARSALEHALRSLGMLYRRRSIFAVLILILLTAAWALAFNLFDVTPETRAQRQLILTIVLVSYAATYAAWYEWLRHRIRRIIRSRLMTLAQREPQSPSPTSPMAS